MGTRRGHSQVEQGLEKGKRYPKAKNPNVKRTLVEGDPDLPPQKAEERKVIGPGRRVYMVNNIEIDHEALFEAAKTHASYRQLGLIFGIGEMTMRNNFDHIIQEARAQRQKELLTAQFDTAITDRNPTMMIWLGKQYLEQKDVSRVESTGPDGGPQKVETTQRVVAYIPENNRDK